MHGLHGRMLNLHRRLVSTAVAPGRWAPGQIGQVAPEKGSGLGPGIAAGAGVQQQAQQAQVLVLVLVLVFPPAAVARRGCHVEGPLWNPWSIRGWAGRDSCVPRRA